MLRVQRNQQNNLVVSVSRHKTIPNAQYLFSFEHIISKEKVRFYPKNISTHENRYDEFVFFEGETPVNYTGDIPYEIFPYPGQYYYSIWEAFTQNSTNPNSAYDKLEEGRCVVYDNTNETPYRYTYTSNNEENANYIYYQPGTNKTGGLQVAISYSAYNQHLQYYTWSVNYPDLIVEDLLTENKIRSANTLYENGYCAGGFNASSGLTTHVDIITGSTSSGFKVYLDPDQMLRLNYVATSGITLTATTYYDFTEAAGSYSCKTIEYYSDGSSVEIPTQPLFEVDMTPPTNVSFSISGNTDCVIPPSPTPTTTSTPTPTPTTTLTPSPTGTPNPTTTPTPTTTSTPTPTTTLTLTPTTTSTPTPTTTLTSTSTGTPTPTPTLTPTNTETPTPTLTPTNTETPTPTPTSTPAPSFDVDAAAYLEAVVSAGGTGITETISAATDTLFVELKSNSLYSKLFAMYPVLGGISASCKFNALNPVDSNAAYRINFIGGWSFDFSGATPNGTTAYGNTYVNPLSATTDNNIHLSYYSLTNSSVGAPTTMGSDAIGQYTRMTIMSSTNVAFNILSSSTKGIQRYTMTDSLGYYLGSANGTDRNFYKNGSLLTPFSQSSLGTTARPNQPIYIAANNAGGGPLEYDDKQCSFSTIGQGLTTGEVSTLSTIINTFQTTLGRNTY